MPTVDELAQKGIAAIEEKRFDEAVAAFIEALALEPGRPDMNNALGMAYLHKGSPDEAVPYLARAVSLSDGYPDAEHGPMKVHFRTALAMAHELQQQGLQAQAVLEETVQRFPDSLEARLQLARVFGGLGLARDAVPHLQHALNLVYRPEDQLSIRTELATALQHCDELDQADAVLKQTIELFPKALKPRLQRAHLLLTSCRTEEGLDVFRDLGDLEDLDDDNRKAAAALVGSAEALLNSEEDPSIFLTAHQGEYVAYFDQVASEQPTWYAEAARMARPANPGDDPLPMIAEGARPYAMTRVDLVNPQTGEVANVYSDVEPMYVGVQGLEPLAQLPIMFEWKDHPLQVWVCSQAPWHWLPITVQLEQAMSYEQRLEVLDGIFGDWYLAGYNGDFGTGDRGRFHYITDPEPVGERALSYVVDLGRSEYQAIDALLKRLVILNATHPIRRVLLGNGYLPD